MNVEVRTFKIYGKLKVSLRLDAEWLCRPLPPCGPCPAPCCSAEGLEGERCSKLFSGNCLAYEARPQACRLYPFWITPGHVLTLRLEALAHHCCRQEPSEAEWLPAWEQHQASLKDCLGDEVAEKVASRLREGGDRWLILPFEAYRSILERCYPDRTLLARASEASHKGLEEIMGQDIR